MTLYVEQLLRRPDSIEYSGFKYSGASVIHKRAVGKLAANFDLSKDTAWVYSPDSTKAISILRYWGEPDHNLEIFNGDGDSTFIEFEFCGTPCYYHGVRWVDSYHFAFVKTEEGFVDRGEKPFLTWLNAFVSLYDLESDSVYNYTSDPVLRRPSLYVDSMISFVWDNPAAVHFIHTTFEEANIPGFRDGSLSQFDFNDSASVDLERSTQVTTGVDYPLSYDGLWFSSPDSSRTAAIVSLSGDSTELRVRESRGDSKVVWVSSCISIRRYLSLRWLSDDILLVLRVDEDGHFSKKKGHRVIDGHVAAVILFNWDRGYQISFGSYITMPD